MQNIKETLREAELIVGLDFTKTNERTGRISFNGKSLHKIEDGIKNPYENIMSILGRITMSSSDMHKPVTCYGFGDATARDDHVFRFNPRDEPFNGFDEALDRYRQIVPNLRFAEPLSFAPIINKGISTAKENTAKQHVLVIVSNGPVYRSQDIERGQLSPHEKETLDAIKHARDYPLSIILIGVGDKSGVMTRFFESHGRILDNLQVVDYSYIMSRPDESKKERNFIVAATKKMLRGSMHNLSAERRHIRPPVSSTEVSVSRSAPSGE
ncbi:hypothetical protein MKW92_029569 [Papaver armeniacum]|nr:hypothetical protein MKW92_029569 [Papaver armeniacum]